MLLQMLLATPDGPTYIAYEQLFSVLSHIAYSRAHHDSFDCIIYQATTTNILLRCC